MQATLVPETVSAEGQPCGRFGRVAGYALTVRTLLLLLAGVLWAVPAFFYPRWAWAMAAWDLLVLSLAAAEAWSLPAPQSILVERRFESALSIAQPTLVTVTVRHKAPRVLDIRVTDDLHPALLPMPRTIGVRAFPTGAAKAAWTVVPNQRGRVRLGSVYLRYRGALGLVERWAVAKLEQDVRVYAEMERAGEMALYLARVRQMEQQKRKLRLKGIGREFESLRDYQPGDEMRNVSWTATARRGKLITRQFTAERSQQVWMVLDAGRLSRTSFQLRHRELRHTENETRDREVWNQLRWAESDTDPVANQAGGLHVTQLDQAAAAAAALAQVVMQSGDKVGLLAYGCGMQQRVLPGAGTGHCGRSSKRLRRCARNRQKQTICRRRCNYCGCSRGAD
ncbi:MAG: DUF58 domain-containing protein [Acidobacteriaceae bacterium]